MPGAKRWGHMQSMTWTMWDTYQESLPWYNRTRWCVWARVTPILIAEFILLRLGYTLIGLGVLLVGVLWMTWWLDHRDTWEKFEEWRERGVTSMRDGAQLKSVQTGLDPKRIRDLLAEPLSRLKRLFSWQLVYEGSMQQVRFSLPFSSLVRAEITFMNDSREEMHVPCFPHNISPSNFPEGKPLSLWTKGEKAIFVLHDPNFKDYCQPPDRADSWLEWKQHRER